jgi:hypothetical protein
VWLLADILGRKLAFDRGAPYLDSQHYEGFQLSKEQLLEFVAQDLEQESQPAHNPAGS